MPQPFVDAGAPLGEALEGQLVQAVDDDQALVEPGLVLDEVDLPPHDLRTQLPVRDDPEIEQHLPQLGLRPVEPGGGVGVGLRLAERLFREPAQAAESPEVDLLAAVLEVVIDHRYALAGRLGRDLHEEGGLSCLGLPPHDVDAPDAVEGLVHSLEAGRNAQDVLALVLLEGLQEVQVLPLRGGERGEGPRALDHARDGRAEFGPLLPGQLQEVEVAFHIGRPVEDPHLEPEAGGQAAGGDLGFGGVVEDDEHVLDESEAFELQDLERRQAGHGDARVAELLEGEEIPLAVGDDEGSVLAAVDLLEVEDLELVPVELVVPHPEMVRLDAG